MSIPNIGNGMLNQEDLALIQARFQTVMAYKQAYYTDAAEGSRKIMEPIQTAPKAQLVPPNHHSQPQQYNYNNIPPHLHIHLRPFSPASPPLLPPQTAMLMPPKEPVNRKRRASRPLIQTLTVGEGYCLSEGPNQLQRRKLSTDEGVANGENLAKETTSTLQTPANREVAATPQVQAPANTWDGRYVENERNGATSESPSTDSAYATRSPTQSEATLESQPDSPLHSKDAPMDFPDLPDIDLTPTSGTGGKTSLTTQEVLEVNPWDGLGGFGSFFGCNDDSKDIGFDTTSKLSPMPLGSSYSPYSSRYTRGSSQISVKNAVRPTALLSLPRALTEPTTEPKEMFSVCSPVLPTMDEINCFDDVVDPFEESNHSAEQSGDDASGLSQDSDSHIPNDMAGMIGWSRSMGTYDVDTFDKFFSTLSAENIKTLVEGSHASLPAVKTKQVFKNEQKEDDSSRMPPPPPSPLGSTTANTPAQSTTANPSLTTRKLPTPSRKQKLPREIIRGLIIPYGIPVTLLYDFVAQYQSQHNASRLQQEAQRRQLQTQGQQKESRSFIDIVRSRVFSEERFAYLTTVIAETLKAYGAKCHMALPSSPAVSPTLNSSSVTPSPDDKTDGSKGSVFGVKGKALKAPSSSPPTPSAPTLPDGVNSKKQRRKYTKKSKEKKTGGALVWLSRLDEQMDHFLLERLYDLRDQKRMVGDAGERCAYFDSEQERFEQAQFWGAGEAQLYEIAERSNEGGDLSPFMLDGKMAFPLWVAYWLWA